MGENGLTLKVRGSRSNRGSKLHGRGDRRRRPASKSRDEEKKRGGKINSHISQIRDLIWMSG
jgi:hypothetical protein